jgi:mRNA interferase RelE/StbE
MDSYRIKIIRSAQKDIRKLPNTTRVRIVKRVHQLAKDPRPSGCEKLKGDKSSYRIRIGDYRVIYRIQKNILLIEILRAGHRREIYKNL